MWFPNLVGTRNIEGWGARVPGRLQDKPQETLMLRVGGPGSAPRAPGIAGMAAGLGSPLQAMVPERHCEVVGALAEGRMATDRDMGRRTEGQRTGRNGYRQAGETEGPETRGPDRRPDRLTGDGRTG